MEQLNMQFGGGFLALLSPDEIYERADERLLFRLKEDRRIERKPANTHPPVLGEYFSMWSNTSPDGGLIALGMENDGTMSGCGQLSPGQINDREKAALTHCPDCRYKSKRVAVTNPNGDQDFVILYRVEYRRDKVVRDVSGEAYHRVADQKQRLTDAEIRELEVDKKQVDLEAEGVLLKVPNDFHSDLITAFVQGVRDRRGLTDERTEIEILALRRLGVIEDGIFRPNVACTLLLAKDPGALFPGCKIRFLRYEGETERTGTDYNVTKDITVEGCVPHLLTEAKDIVQGQLREFSRLDEHGKFFSVPEYPFEAWFEAIVNACAHRSYAELKNVPVTIKMFDDRLTVESPGAFLPFVTPENIYDVGHVPRNPRLMDALYYLEFVKAHNEGTRRMRDAMQGMNLPLPKFEQKNLAVGGRWVRVTLKNNRNQRKAWVVSNVAKILPPDTLASLSENERRILNYISENGRINITEAQRILTSIRSWETVKKLLMKLSTRQILQHIHRKDLERDPDAHFIIHPKW